SCSQTLLPRWTKAARPLARRRRRKRRAATNRARVHALSQPARPACARTANSTDRAACGVGWTDLCIDGMTTALVTGANRGIGLELCRQLKASGARVIAVCRKSSKELDALDVRVE